MLTKLNFSFNKSFELWIFFFMFKFTFRYRFSKNELLATALSVSSRESER